MAQQNDPREVARLRRVLKKVVSSKDYKETIGQLINDLRDRYIGEAQNAENPTQKIQLLGAEMGLRRLEFQIQNTLRLSEKAEEERKAKNKKAQGDSNE